MRPRTGCTPRKASWHGASATRPAQRCKGRVRVIARERCHFSRCTLYSSGMPEPHVVIPTRAPAATSADDTILPFQVEALDLRGRLVRFGPAIDSILSRHRYPAPVARLLGEAIVLTVLLGSTLRFEGRFI